MAKPEDLDFTALSFGAHKGRTPEAIAEDDPGYIVWLYKSIKPAVCSEALYKSCQEEVTSVVPSTRDTLVDTFDRFNGRR